MKTRKHECQALREGFGAGSEFNWRLENRGDGWYMYNTAGQQSPSQYSFCPSCGEKLEKEGMQ